MPGYVALLRGINVGGNKKIAMADLRALLTGLGYSAVRTYVNSGNAVFHSTVVDAAIVAGHIEHSISENLGMSVRCLVRTDDELRTVINGNPLAEVATAGSKMMALFLSEPPDPELLATHDPTELAPADVRLGERVIYQWCPDGLMAAPPVSAFVEKRLKVAVTARNWNTVTKLGALLDGMSAA